jgi:ParB family chromosome partitioning protein
MLVARTTKGETQKDASPVENIDPNVTAAIRALEQVVGTKVTIQDSGGKGRIELHFYSQDELNRLYEGLMRARF